MLKLDDAMAEIGRIKKLYRHKTIHDKMLGDKIVGQMMTDQISPDDAVERFRFVYSDLARLSNAITQTEDPDWYKELVGDSNEGI